MAPLSPSSSTFTRCANRSPSRSSRPISSGWRTWRASEYGLGDYYVYLPPDKASDKQFKVKLSLKEMQWKLAGIDLPQPMRVELAQQLMNQRAERANSSLPPSPIQPFLNASRFDSKAWCAPRD